MIRKHARGRETGDWNPNGIPCLRLAKRNATRWSRNLGRMGQNNHGRELRRALRSGKTLPSRPFSFHPRSSHSQEPQASLRDPGLALPKFSLALRIRPTLARNDRGGSFRTARLDEPIALRRQSRSTPHSVTWRTSRNLSSTSFFSTPCNGALKKNSLLGQFEGRTFMPETSPKFPILVDKENTLRT